MAELVPIPLPLLLRRAFLEFQRERKIFDLPESKIFRNLPGLDLSVSFHGHRAATPLGPAAGPHGQLAQNIALSWLGGSRIIELKTVQILDELKIPRPCIDAANVGYNVEWSQELKLEESLREYVKASMFLEILQASGMLGEDVPKETVFDMSVGYNLEGIRSPRVAGWIQSMKNAGPVIDELRTELTGKFACCRKLNFPTCISDTVSLSTFHGCPANEIEGIVTFLLVEMGCHVCIKLNPTLLGKEEVSRLLHEVMGYREIQLHPPAFENDLQFDEAIDLIPRLQQVAQRHGRSLSLKFTNTLVVKNHKQVFGDELMYMSGAPLHVLAVNLAQRFRDRLPAPIPMSFSGGLDAHNVAATVAMGFVPVTTCTDLLRPGGYARLIRYLENLGSAMRGVGATNIAEFVEKHRGKERELVAEATANPRYSWERNQGVPRKIGSKLWLYDCINCDKCVPVCPNDANFAYETRPKIIVYDNFQFQAGNVRRIPGGTLRVMKAHQLANYADACNECGNCDVFCPEDGGPQNEKPRFFGSLESLQRDSGPNGFYIDWEAHAIHGAIARETYELSVDAATDRARFRRRDAEFEIRWSDNEALSSNAPATLDLLPYLKLKILLESIERPAPRSLCERGRNSGEFFVIVSAKTELKKALFHGRDWITTQEWTDAELDVMLDVAGDLKRKFKGRVPHRYLADQTIFLMFFDKSTRTRNSFEAGMTQLGGHAHFLTADVMQVSHGESPKDTGIILSSYGHAIAIRHDLVPGEGNSYMREVAKWADAPVINMQCDVDHPCQTLADLMTIRELRGRDSRGLKVAVSWAYAPSYAKPLSVPQGLIMLMPRFGMDVTLAHPSEYNLMPETLRAAEENAVRGGGKFRVVDDMDEAFRDADVVIPKSWGCLDTMGSNPAESLRIAKQYTSWICNEERMKLAKRDVLYMHPLPADRGNEVTDEVIDGANSVVYQEAENRLHTAKAIMALTMADAAIEYEG